MSCKYQRLQLVWICSIYAITEHLPEQYQVCLSALDTILRHVFEILETSHDNREKLHAMELFKDTHLVKLELLSNTTTIDSALNYIINKQQQPQQSQQQQQQKRQLALDSTSNDNSDSQLTTTGRQTPIIIHNTYFGPSK